MEVIISKIIPKVPDQTSRPALPQLSIIIMIFIVTTSSIDPLLEYLLHKVNNFQMMNKYRIAPNLPDLKKVNQTLNADLSSVTTVNNVIHRHEAK